MGAMESVIRDIPRFYTGIAEWSACLAAILLLRKRIHGWQLFLAAVSSLFLQTTFMVVTAGAGSDLLWILCMAIATVLMFFFIRICTDTNRMDTIYYTARAFLLAEFMASFEWQIYCFFWPDTEAAFPIQLLMIAGIYGLICLLMVQLDKRNIPPEGSLNISFRELITALTIVIVVFSISNLSFVSANTPFSGLYNSEIMNIRTIVDLGGLAILYAYFVQCAEFRTRSELEAMQNVFKNQYMQYQQSRENIDALNRKYHDFKHQIAVLRAETDIDRKNAYLDEMEKEIKMYEAQNKTGNQVLDTILTSKTLYCESKQITLTSVVDGKLLDFIYTMDLCSIFGNALDNAIEYEQRLEDPAKRLIHLSVSAQKGFILIQVENYFEGQLQFQDNLPITTKMDKAMHGFGMKSMRHAAQKYGGTLTTSVSNNWFELKILIPR